MSSALAIATGVMGAAFIAMFAASAASKEDDSLVNEAKGSTKTFLPNDGAIRSRGSPIVFSDLKDTPQKVGDGSDGSDGEIVLEKYEPLRVLAVCFSSTSCRPEYKNFPDVCDAMKEDVTVLQAHRTEKNDEAVFDEKLEEFSKGTLPLVTEKKGRFNYVIDSCRTDIKRTTGVVRSIDAVLRDDGFVFVIVKSPTPKYDRQLKDVYERHFEGWDDNVSVNVHDGDKYILHTLKKRAPSRPDQDYVPVKTKPPSTSVDEEDKTDTDTDTDAEKPVGDAEKPVVDAKKPVVSSEGKGDSELPKPYGVCYPGKNSSFKRLATDVTTVDDADGIPDKKASAIVYACLHTKDKPFTDEIAKKLVRKVVDNGKIYIVTTSQNFVKHEMKSAGYTTSKEFEKTAFKAKSGKDITLIMYEFGTGTEPQKPTEPPRSFTSGPPLKPTDPSKSTEQSLKQQLKPKPPEPSKRPSLALTRSKIDIVPTNMESLKPVIVPDGLTPITEEDAYEFFTVYPFINMTQIPPDRVVLDHLAIKNDLLFSLFDLKKDIDLEIVSKYTKLKSLVAFSTHMGAVTSELKEIDETIRNNKTYDKNKLNTIIDSIEKRLRTYNINVLYVKMQASLNDKSYSTSEYWKEMAADALKLARFHGADYINHAIVLQMKTDLTANNKKYSVELYAPMSPNKFLYNNILHPEIVQNTSIDYRWVLFNMISKFAHLNSVFGISLVKNKVNRILDFVKERTAEFDKNKIDDLKNIIGKCDRASTVEKQSWFNTVKRTFYPDESNKPGDPVYVSIKQRYDFVENIVKNDTNVDSALKSIDEDTWYLLYAVSVEKNPNITMRDITELVKLFVGDIRNKRIDVNISDFESYRYGMYMLCHLLESHFDSNQQMNKCSKIDLAFYDPTKAPLVDELTLYKFIQETRRGTITPTPEKPKPEPKQETPEKPKPQDLQELLAKGRQKCTVNDFPDGLTFTKKSDGMDTKALEDQNRSVFFMTRVENQGNLIQVDENQYRVQTTVYIGKEGKSETCIFYNSDDNTYSTLEWNVPLKLESDITDQNDIQNMFGLKSFKMVDGGSDIEFHTLAAYMYADNMLQCDSAEGGGGGNGAMAIPLLAVVVASAIAGGFTA